MSDFLIQSRIEELEKAGIRRVLKPPKGLDFSSNDYLGFCNDTDFKSSVRKKFLDLDIPLGSSGSRLLRGSLDYFEEVEQDLADFSSQESAVIFPSGYQANVGLLSSLLKPDDQVFSDELNHASLIDGIKLSRARKEIFKHNDLEHLESLLKHSGSTHSKKHLRVIVTESLFGMEGDFAPLRELVELAEKYNVLLVVDEAHATGLWGNFAKELGGGLVQSLGLSHRVFATIHPAGKALGVGGAWVSGSRLMKDYLVNFSRAFIFSTAPSPFVALLLQSSLIHWKAVGIKRSQILFTFADALSIKLNAVGDPATNKKRAPILPVLLGENSYALKIANSLQSQGFDVRCIRPPTVPSGTARLRLTVHTHNSMEEIHRLAKAIDTERNSVL